MAGIPPQHLASFAKGGKAAPQTDPGLDDSDAALLGNDDGSADAGGADEATASPDQRWTPEQLKSLQSKDVRYLEISEDASGFGCGGCKFANASDHCANKKVNAPISTEHGTCKLWEPKDPASVTFPPDYKAQEAAETPEDEAAEGDEDMSDEDISDMLDDE